MGHLKDYMDFSRKTSVREMSAARADYIECNGERDHGMLMSHDNGFKLHENIICDSYEEAIRKIESLDNGWYDDHGVLYKSYKGKNKTMENLEAKRAQLRKDRREYIENNGIHNRTSETISCPKCKSRLALAYFRGNECPLCRTDLRSETVLKRIESFDTRIKETEKKYKEAEKKQKYELRWLVKIEFHV